MRKSARYTVPRQQSRPAPAGVGLGAAPAPASGSDEAGPAVVWPGPVGGPPPTSRLGAALVRGN